MRRRVATRTGSVLDCCQDDPRPLLDQCRRFHRHQTHIKSTRRPQPWKRCRQNLQQLLGGVPIKLDRLACLALKLSLSRSISIELQYVKPIHRESSPPTLDWPVKALLITRCLIKSRNQCHSSLLHRWWPLGTRNGPDELSAEKTRSSNAVIRAEELLNGG